jgi:hypothetical protein
MIHYYAKMQWNNIILNFRWSKKQGGGAQVSLPGQCASIPAFYAPGYTF